MWMASRSDKTIITWKLAAGARWAARSGRSSSLQLAEGSSQFARSSHLSISVSTSIGATSVPGWPNRVRLPIIAGTICIDGRKVARWLFHGLQIPPMRMCSYIKCAPTLCVRFRSLVHGDETVAIKAEACWICGASCGSRVVAGPPSNFATA